MSCIYFGYSLIQHLYDVAGNKLRQLEYKEGILKKTTDFVANFVFTNGKPAWYNFDEGRIVYANNNSYFTETFLKDHLGNIRVAFGYSDNNVITRQVNSYYPFGMNIKELSVDPVFTAVSFGASKNEYKFNGKMMQDEMGLGWLDYGRRMYDLQLGRWHSVDPMAEKYRRWSPYNYCVDNPMRFVDPDGMRIDKYFDESGKLLYDTKTGNREFIMRTSKTKDVLMREYEANPNVSDQLSDVNGIKPEEASKTADLVSKGEIKGPHMSNFVELDSKATRNDMKFVISLGKDNGKGGLSELNNREVGSTISSTGHVGKPIYGKAGIPGKDANIFIDFGIVPILTRTFHSHSSGSDGTSSWSQLPSKVDQENASAGSHYIFPMRESNLSNQSVFLYNNTGIIAVVPKTIF